MSCRTPAPRRGAAPPTRVEVQGHRGCRGLRPENTLPAFQHAVVLGVDVLELDLALTADGVLIVVHDPEINPTICDGAEQLPSRRYRDLTLAQVQRLDCGSRRHPKFPDQQPVPGTRIPPLARVLDLLDAHGALRANAEIKTFPARPELTRPPGEFAEVLVSLLRRRGMLRRVVVQSFDPRALQAVARLAPEVVLSALVEHLPEADRLLESTRATILSPRWSELQRADVERLHARGVRVVPWTVNAPDEMRTLIGWGVDGLISDRPDLLLDLLRRR